MAEFEAGVIIIERPIEEVWNFVTDLSKHSEWCAEGDKEQQTSPGPLGVGSTYFAENPKNGKRITGRIDEYEPNRKVTYEGTSGLAKGTTISCTFEPIEGGKTRLRETVELRPRGFTRLLMPFVASSLKRRVKASAETGFSNIKRILESQGQAAPA